MQTHHTTDPNGFYENTTQMAGKWINETTSMLTEAYNKQMNLSFGVYNNYMKSLIESYKNMITPTKNNSVLFYQPDLLMKGMQNPFKYFMWNDGWPVSSSKYIEKSFRQMLDLNHQWLNSFNKEFHLNGANMNGVVEAFRKIMENDLDAGKNIFMTYFDVSDEQLEFALESFKKLQEETNKEFKRMVKVQEELMLAIIKSNQPNEHDNKTTKDFKDSDSHSNSIKKTRVNHDS